MAGYIIHLSVAEEFLRNFPNEIKNYDEFIEGVIFPDSVADKSLTHYGPKSSQVHLDEFFNDRDITDDFNKGYFIHLITDYLFYNKFLEKFSKKYIYSDYDFTNKTLKEKFKVKVPKKIEDKIFYLEEGKTKILNLEQTIEFIRKTAKNNLNDIKECIIKGDNNWLEIIPLNNI